jgi:hypothetical protein
MTKVTEEFLKSVEDAHAKSTQGEWKAFTNPHNGSCWVQGMDSPSRPICDTHGSFSGDGEKYLPDAGFIALAHSAVPKLVTEIRELRGKLGTLEVYLQVNKDKVDDRDAEIARLRAAEETYMNETKKMAGAYLASQAETARLREALDSARNQFLLIHQHTMPDRRGHVARGVASKCTDVAFIGIADIDRAALGAKGGK